MTIRILDVSGIPVKACASFQYRGYLISMSNIMTSYFEVMVFVPNDLKFSKSFSTVEEAIDAIDNHYYITENVTATPF